MSAVAHSPSSTGAAAPSRNIRAMPSPNTRKAGPGIRSGAYSRRHKQMEFPTTTEPEPDLALGQRPEALFITCADSRIDPCLLTQTKPGELFICRVIGNVVPPYPDAIGGVSATIEYAVGVLRVPEVIVCGHTDCGVMRGALNPEALEAYPNVTAWLRYVTSS